MLLLSIVWVWIYRWFYRDLAEVLTQIQVFGTFVTLNYAWRPYKMRILFCYERSQEVNCRRYLVCWVLGGKFIYLRTKVCALLSDHGGIDLLYWYVGMQCRMFSWYLVFRSLFLLALAWNYASPAKFCFMGVLLFYLYLYQSGYIEMPAIFSR